MAGRVESSSLGSKPKRPKVVTTRDSNVQTFDLRLPVWPFFALAWIGDVAAVLMEPALTNIGIVPPVDGFHDALREATRRYETPALGNPYSTPVSSSDTSHNLRPTAGSLP